MTREPIVLAKVNFIRNKAKQKYINLASSMTL